mgnify:CR=1 FL=1|jgi:hypothetical protein
MTSENPDDPNATLPTFGSFNLDKSMLQREVEKLEKQITLEQTLSFWRLDRLDHFQPPIDLDAKMRSVVSDGYEKLAPDQAEAVKFWDWCRFQHRSLLYVPAEDDLSGLTHMLLRENSRKDKPWSEEDIKKLLSIAEQVASKTNDAVPSASGDSSVNPC